MKRRFLFVFSFLLISICLLYRGAPVAAQQAINELFITGSDDRAAPTFDLYVYAVDGQGNLVDLTGQQLVINHGGVAVDEMEIVGKHSGGTLTIFIIDIPEGVASSISTIGDSIKRFAGDPYMEQETDFVAIYRVGELGATEMLKPNSFHNSVINVFASQPAPSTGSTALIDSIMDIMNNLDAIKPEENMPVHIVVISDGTDVVSTQNEPEDVPRRAAELGVPLHTIWLDNQSLSGDRKRVGQQYLTQIAAGTRGESAVVTSPDQFTALWDKISSFRDQTILRYTVDEASAGDHRVEVSLAGNPSISAETTVTVLPGAPRIALDIPEESRQMTLENVNQPVLLSFSTIITWPDDIERTFTQAALKVNGILLAQPIDVSQLEKFEISVGPLIYGTNRFQVEAIDDQGHRINTPEVTITILEGETVISDAIAPGTAVDRILDRFASYGKYVLYCLLAIIVIVIVVVVIKFMGRSKLPTNLRLPSFFRRIPFLRRYVRGLDGVRRYGYRASRVQREASRYAPDVKGVDSRGKKQARPSAFLEVLETTSQMPGRVDLEAVEIRLGRSSKQADIAFTGDGTVSRIHSTIVQEGGDYRVFDEQSTSGTFVNEQRVPQHGLQLTDGDEIRMGAVRLRFRQP
jgi:hypothetical protein